MGEQPAMNEPGRERTPEEIRQDIAETRDDMSVTVSQIEDRVSPTRIRQRQQAKVRNRWDRMRSSVMGSRDTGPSYGYSTTSGYTPNYGYDVDQGTSRTGEARERFSEGTGEARERLSEGAGQARDRISEGASRGAEALRDAPDQAMQQAQGNPFAAGLMAFGAGALLGTLLPASQPEQRAAQTLRDRYEDDVKEGAKQIAQTAKEELQPKAQQATEEIKSTAQEAAQQTKSDATDSAQRVQGEAQQAKTRIQES